jgi:hypothetical protein
VFALLAITRKRGLLCRLPGRPCRWAAAGCMGPGLGDLRWEEPAVRLAVARLFTSRCLNHLSGQPKITSLGSNTT